MLEAHRGWLDQADSFRMTGTVTRVAGLVVESAGPAVALGDFCEIRTRSARIRAQVIGFRDGAVLSMPLDETSGLSAGDLVLARGSEARMPVSTALLGRVLDGFGQPMDGGPPIEALERYGLFQRPPGPLERKPIDEALATGIRAIDSFLTCGKGQRIGIFGGSGVGKSTLLGCLARHNRAEVTVLALIGERNREVRDFLEHELPPEARRRTVVVVSTSDRPAPLRIRACFVALAVAEYFRDLGKDVLLVADSVTRLAMAQREIGLAAGEPPSQKGYTPSVFDLLPKVCERAGRFEHGSITGFFTVLVEGDDLNEPITDAVRGILDGHIVLSRQLGSAGHYPAIDVLQSVSRLAPRLSTVKQAESVRKLRGALAALRASEDLIRMGAYVAGSDPGLDAALRLREPLDRFLRQRPEEQAAMPVTLQALDSLAGGI